MITASPTAYDEWPRTAARIVRRLRAFGVERMNAEDLASEALTRALAKQMVFESNDHLFNWAMLVARNLYFDQRRAESRGPAVCAIDDVDVASSHDTPSLVEHRMSLERVLDAMRGLSDADRMAVMSDSTPRDRKEAVRLNVRRHRARARLRAALAGVAALLGLRRPRNAGLALAPAAFLSVLVTVGLPFVAPHRTRTAAPPRAIQLDAARPPARRTVLPPAGRTTARKVVAPPRRRVRPPVPNVPRSPRPPTHVTTLGVGGLQTKTRIEPNRPEGESLVCVNNVPGVPSICIGKPVV